MNQNHLENCSPLYSIRLVWINKEIFISLGDKSINSHCPFKFKDQEGWIIDQIIQLTPELREVRSQLKLFVTPVSFGGEELLLKDFNL